MGNIHTVNCVLTSEVADNNVPSLMKRTCQRMSFKRDKSSTLPDVSGKLHKANKKRVSMKVMPRCSSFEDLSSLLPSSKKADYDPTYLLWKRSFEKPREKSTVEKRAYLERIKRRVFDMSSIISGHLTPRGLPSHAHIMKTKNSKKQESPKKKPLQLPLLDDSPCAERKIPVMQSDYSSQHHQHHHHKNQQFFLQLPSHVRMTNKMPITAMKASTQPKYTLTPLNLLSKLPESKQAIIIERLYRDIKDLESHYDTQMESFVI